MAAADQQTSLLAFQQTLTLAKNIATELKATLELVILVTSPRSSPFDPESVGLSSDTPVSLVRGKFVRQVSQMLQMDDLLILTAHTQLNSLLSLPGQLMQPETIARIHPDTSMIVVHFPTNL